MKETEVQKEILKNLRKEGIFVWRVNNTGVPDPNAKGGWRKQNGFNMPGMSDILGIFNSRFLAIEVKAPGRIKNVSEKQQKFINNVKKEGGMAFVADSWEMVENKLKL